MNSPKLPFHLAHQPLVAVPYADLDGPYAGNTDAFYLSLGLAQWEDRAQVTNPTISAKIWRHSDERWSRQSEEMPLHRVIDLVILILATLKQADSRRVHLPAGTFENQTTDLNLPVYGDFELPEETHALLRRRLQALIRILAIHQPELLKEALKGTPPEE